MAREAVLWILQWVLSTGISSHVPLAGSYARRNVNGMFPSRLTVSGYSKFTSRTAKQQR
jgi:hypothetical protein